MSQPNLSGDTGGGRQLVVWELWALSHTGQTNVHNILIDI